MKKLMKARFSLILVVAVLAGCVGGAQRSGYVGQEARAIKALSPDRVAGLLAGEGLGYAKAAELNGYPGPAHVLELADALQLTEAQRSASEAIFKRMKVRAKQLGEQLVGAERNLELAFRKNTVSTESLADLVARAGELNAQVRNAHLVAHIEQTAVLSKEQIARYVKLRGYGSGAHTHHKH
jgi:hypothetical protein